jgi:hypothetical protein
MAQQRAWLPVFLEFIQNLRIDSKEEKAGGILKPYGAQLRFLEETCAGLDNGIRFFICLKARQLGISTISLAIDLFWLSLHPGLQAALITDTEGNRDKFRQILERMVSGLPKRLKVPIDKHNRNFMLFRNGSVLDFLVAGTRKGSSLGRSRAYNYVHGTETAFWGDPAGIESLMASIAETHPDRLYLMESTANGYNHFREMWNNARRDIHTQKAFFIGWWAKELNRIERSDPRFDYYMAAPIEPEEAELRGVVLDQYGFRIDDEQIAWYRWREATRTATEGMMGQEFPWHERQAFVMTGTHFFSTGRLEGDLDRIQDGRSVVFKAYRYNLGEQFIDSHLELEQVFTSSEAELRIWEEPMPRGKYVIGVDPAYGRNDWKDRHAVSVWRCYADKLIQVAEYAAHDIETYQVAWVLAHLAGSYRDCMINIEVNGPGASVMQELKNVKSQLQATSLAARVKAKGLDNAFDNARWYLYHRPDSMSAGYAYGWKTNADNKFTVMNGFRNAYHLGTLIVRSGPLVEEMEGTVQDGGDIGAPGRGKDDRVFAAAFAHHAWMEWVRPEMTETNQTFDAVIKLELDDMSKRPRGFVDNIITAFFADKDKARAEQEWKDFHAGRKFR